MTITKDTTPIILARVHAAAIAEHMSAAYWQREGQENYRSYLVERTLEDFEKLAATIEGIKAFLSSGEPEETGDELLDGVGA